MALTIDRPETQQRDAPRRIPSADPSRSRKNQQKADASGLTSATSTMSRVPARPRRLGSGWLGFANWQIRPGGHPWRRIVPSPERQAIVQLPIHWPLQSLSEMSLRTEA